KSSKRIPVIPKPWKSSLCFRCGHIIGESWIALPDKEIMSNLYLRSLFLGICLQNTFSRLYSTCITGMVEIIKDTKPLSQSQPCLFRLSQTPVCQGYFMIGHSPDRLSRLFIQVIRITFLRNISFRLSMSNQYQQARSLHIFSIKLLL